ncbi:hypothetical protein [Alkalinema pantanalense]
MDAAKVHPVPQEANQDAAKFLPIEKIGWFAESNYHAKLPRQAS